VGGIVEDKPPLVHVAIDGMTHDCHPGLDPGSRNDKAWIPAFAGMTVSLGPAFVGISEAVHRYLQNA
jgi:hypothetical protein